MDKNETAARASAVVAGGDPVAKLSPQELAAGLRDLFAHRATVHESLVAAAELTKVALGLSETAPEPKDKRFADTAYANHPIYRPLAQSYVVWADFVERLVAAASDTTNGAQDADAEYTAFRARSAAQLLTSSLAPTNFLPGNPAAVRRAVETGGLSLLKGTRNWLQDVRTNRGLPSMVDSRPYKVGENLAATPGAVVHREEMFELLQYQPTTATVGSRPLLIVPPQVNKYYFLDLAPRRSLVEYLVGQGIQVFLVAWRNPRQQHGHWGMEDYLAAQLRALDVVGAVSGAEDVNLFGACAGGLSSGLLLGHLAGQQQERVHAATFIICMLESSRTNVIKLLSTPGMLERTEKEAREGKVYDRIRVSHNFAWMRPDDLIFNYVANNWLMGEDPPTFDLLAWNNDGTALSARFDADMLDIYGNNRLGEPGGVTALGTPVDLGKVTCDTFVIAGMTDHITPWQACFMTTQVLGGSSEVVITSTGHIQTVVNPVGKARARYYHAGAAPGQSPEEWLQSATEHADSWWPRYAEWLKARSGQQVDAPRDLGSPEYPALDPAPGQYVHEK
jgi:polyhydroxyalkanoate synthase subunit PhaC